MNLHLLRPLFESTKEPREIATLLLLALFWLRCRRPGCLAALEKFRNCALFLFLLVKLRNHRVAIRTRTRTERCAVGLRTTLGRSPSGLSANPLERCLTLLNLRGLKARLVRVSARGARPSSWSLTQSLRMHVDRGRLNGWRNSRDRLS